MEQPLLALTRRTAEGASAENMRQLIQLRWLAVAGQLATILIVHAGMGVPLPLMPMLLVVAALAIANLLTLPALRRHEAPNAALLIALLFDVAALTLQLFFSGGAANPFIWLFLLQVVLGAILLETWSALLLMGATAASFALLSVAYVPLRYPAVLQGRVAQFTRLGEGISFALVAVLLVLFVTRISRNLRARDQYLADLRQRAAEEDGIVRMGLFASGAAHELGTPLASLAVILADWKRVPAIAGDPDLAEERAVMEAEVQRCKAIVTQILHSAGKTRGEAMASAPAVAFLAPVIENWRAGHPSTTLEVEARALEQARIVADPALRQAVTNLLDNAAEASPAWVRLEATRADGLLCLAVADRGIGFPPDQLASLGTLHQSSKGAGHGVGLFLAANVARRLGGRLEAENGTRGAAVRLWVPLAKEA